MRAVLWNEEMSVGVASIDAQHKKLLEVINDLREALILGRGAEVHGPLFQELAEYISDHFSNEEFLMRENLFPEIESHIRAHEGFTSKVRQMQQKTKETPEGVTDEALSFLWKWLIEHDVLIDRKLGSFLNERGVR